MNYPQLDDFVHYQFGELYIVIQMLTLFGRIAMIGYVVPEKFGTFGDIKLGGDVKFSDVPNGVQALFKVPAVTRVLHFKLHPSSAVSDFSTATEAAEPFNR